MAPEMIQPRSVFDYRVDIWSLGIVMAQMLTGELPYFNANAQNLMRSIVIDDINYSSDQWSSIDIEVVDLVENLI